MAWPSDIHLDRRTTLTGVHSGGTTTWTLPYSDTTIDTVVLSGSGHGADQGKILTTADDLTNSTTTLTASGDYSADEAVVGRSFDYEMELTRPYAQRQDGGTEVDDRVSVRQITVAHRHTGGYTIEATATGFVGQVETFSKTFSEADEETGEMSVHVVGDSKETRFFVKNDTPRQSNISTIEMILDVNPSRSQI